MASMLYINGDGNFDYTLQYDGNYSLAYAIGAGISPGAKIGSITGNIESEDRTSYQISTIVNSYSMGAIEQNCEISIKQKDDDVVFCSHSTKSAIWFYNLNKGIDAEQSYVIYPSKERNIEVDESFSLEIVPELLEFAKYQTSEYGIKGTIEIKNPGVKIGGVTSGIDIALHNNGSIIGSKQNPIDSIVTKFSASNGIRGLRYYLEAVSNIDKIYVGQLTDNNVNDEVPPITIISEASDRWDPFVIETIDTKKYVTVSRNKSPNPNEENEDGNKDGGNGDNKTSIIIGVVVAVVVFIIIIVVAVVVIVRKKNVDVDSTPQAANDDSCKI